MTSGDINGYLKEISGRDVTAKDCRTWSGTVLAALALAELEKVDSQAAAKRNIRAAIEKVAARLAELVELGALDRVGERRYARYHLTIANKKGGDGADGYVQFCGPLL